MQQHVATAAQFSRPDYAGRGLANLMASILGGLGSPGEAPAELPDCEFVSRERLRESRHVVLLVIDGLGRAQLDAHAPDGALAGARVADLTSVFPSTTASAVTTFMTGDVPLVHGLIGWHLWFRGLGVVGAPLPFRVRGTDVALERLGAQAPALFGTRPLASRLARRSVLICPANLRDSAYTRAHAGDAERRAFTTLDELFEHVVALGSERVPSFAYVYWPLLDTLSHVHGAGSPHARRHLREVDRAVARAADRLAGSGTLLIVCADHGFVDTRETDRLALEDHPALAETLALPLCGEPRMAFCHVRAGAASAFESYVRGELARAVAMRTADEVVAEGLLGPGEAHPELASRLGSHVLFLRERFCLTDRVAGERGRFSQVGVHGGMSDEELRVPLSVFSA